MADTVKVLREFLGPLKTGPQPLVGQNNNILDGKMAADLRSEKVSSLSQIGHDSSVLQRFYSGASVLVTGATGFMGKVLIEKLLRSCPEIENIYLIVREKKGRSMEERIDDLVSSPCFNLIKKESPKFRMKLHAVAGDIGLEGLGITDADRLLLEQKVDIVFHVAATVRFDEQLKTAILQNVRGTREVLNLCKTFERLRAVLHVSTAYSHCPSQEIRERLLDSPLDCRKAIELAETLDADLLEELTPTLIREWPNSYAFTKAVSEDVVKTYGEGLPVGVFRPAIVVSTKAEPMPGWIDNLYGPSGAAAGVTAGVLRTMQLDGNVDANIVPCDMVINSMIASAWDVATNRESAEVPVFNYISPHENPLRWTDFVMKYFKHGQDYPPMQCIWYWSMTFISNRHVYLLVRFFLHILPALLMDLFLLATNKKPQMLQIYNKIHRFIDIISYFGTRHWDFQDGNVVNLWEMLDSRDRELFFFNMRDLDWDSYIKGTCPGLRLYLLKNSEDTLPAARTRYKKLYVLHRLTQCVLLCLLLWLSLLFMSYVFSSDSSVTPAHLNVAAHQTPTVS